MENNKVTIEKYIIENSHLRESLLGKEFALQEKDASLQKSAKLLQEKDASLQKSAKLLQEKDASLQKSAKLLQEKDASLQKSAKLLQEKDASLQKSVKLLQERERVIANKDAEIQRHLSSFRYQAGTCFYDATHSLKAFLLLPLRLVKLFLRYKQSK